MISFLIWLPTGLYLAPLVLLMLSRGLDLATVAAVGLGYSLTVTLLELPTGGLADVIGRRTVLVVSAVASLTGLLLLGLAESIGLLVASAVLRGIARALQSGPAEAWFVDATHAAEGPDADLSKGLSGGSAAASAALGIGTLAGGALPLLPGASLALPVLIAAVVEVARLVFTVYGLPEAARPRTTLAGVLRGVPATIRTGLRLSVGHQAIARLLVVVAASGVALATIELITPAWMATLTGKPGTAGIAYAIVASLGFATSSMGSALSTRVSEALGTPARAVATSVLIAAGSLAILAASARLTGLAGLIVAGLSYCLLFTALGIGGPAGATILHGHVTAGERATVISVQSLALQLAGAVAAVSFGWLSGTAGPWVAFGAAAGLVALSALALIQRSPQPVLEKAEF
ncbi:MFS transporter [Longispora albida]|uniref:MFS transporter n=1 Tax=Longispora albida TaxID=203523 RepID=UPI00058E7D94|nr:MFS transporter [Longispora albida]